MVGGIFTNRSLNKLHLHYGLIRFAENTTTVFWLIVLYQMGYLLWQVFLIWGTIFIARLIIRSIVPYFLNKYGLKAVVIAWSSVYIGLSPVFYLALHGIIPLWIYLLFFAFTTAFYWYPFHILYWLVGDVEKRGRQSAIREAYARFAQILSPLFAWLVLKVFGATGLFLLGTAFFVIALLCLLQIREPFHLPVTLDWKSAIRITSKRGFVMSFLYAFWELFFDFAWAFVIFFLFHENTATMGGIISFVILMRIVIDYFVGRSIDLKHSQQWYNIGAVVIISAVIGRVVFGFTLLPVLIFDVLLMLGYSLFQPYESVLIYNSIKESAHPEWFALIMEAGWDVGSIVASFLLAGLLYFWFDLRHSILSGIIAIPLTVLLYRRYFSYIQSPTPLRA